MSQSLSSSALDSPVSDVPVYQFHTLLKYLLDSASSGLSPAGIYRVREGESEGIVKVSYRRELKRLSVSLPTGTVLVVSFPQWVNGVCAPMLTVSVSNGVSSYLLSGYHLSNEGIFLVPDFAFMPSAQAIDPAITVYQTPLFTLCNATLSYLVAHLPTSHASSQVALPMRSAVRFVVSQVPDSFVAPRLGSVPPSEPPAPVVPSVPAVYPLAPSVVVSVSFDEPSRVFTLSNPLGIFSDNLSGFEPVSLRVSAPVSLGNATLFTLTLSTPGIFCDGSFASRSWVLRVPDDSSESWVLRSESADGSFVPGSSSGYLLPSLDVVGNQRPLPAENVFDGDDSQSGMVAVIDSWFLAIVRALVERVHGSEV